MRIVLITGIEDENNKMEIIKPDNSTTTCREKYNYPMDIRGASGAIIDKSIIVCGGYPTTSECHSFGHGDKSWTKIADMTTPRRYAASVPLKDALWIGGGIDDGDNVLNSTELVYLNGRQSSPKTQLPEERVGSCAAEYNGQILFTGGYDGNDAQKNTWLINTNDDFKVTNGPNMLKTRDGHSCGIFHSHAHSGRAVIVAAGSSSFGGTGSRNCEFWDFTVPGTTWKLCSKSWPNCHFGKCACVFLGGLAALL